MKIAVVILMSTVFYTFRFHILAIHTLKFHTFNFHAFTLSIFTIHTFTLSISIWWWAGWCWWWWCWQCGIVAEPSCVALCVTLITPQHDSPKIPSPTPHAHADTYLPPPQIPRAFLKLFWEKKSDVSPKREAPRYQSLIRPASFQSFSKCWILLFGLIWWHVVENQDDLPDKKLTRLTL